MIRFECDYAEGCHPKILEALQKTNFEQTCGYGLDPHSKRAEELIKKACENEDARVYLVSGGTQANKVVIAQVLRPHQGVVSVEGGHIAHHEAGAIESSGHKVVTLKPENGKLKAETLKAYLADYWADDTHEHIVQPGMVYISSPTELGTVYTKAELSALHNVCREYNIPLYLDGARLGSGFASKDNDLTLADLSRVTDIFYIGGTKVGALFGEAIVFNGDKGLDQDFRSLIKQNGAMLAKGRILGIQFEELFKDNLYFDISRKAVEQAERIKKAFLSKGYKLWIDSPTNQQFPILPKDAINKLKEKFAFLIWPDTGEPKLITRFCTSWATKDEDVDKLIDEINKL